MLSSTLLVAGCFGDKDEQKETDPNVVGTGDTVTVSYTMKWSDGKVFATNLTGTKKDSVSSRSLDRHIQETFVAGNANTVWGSAVLGHKKNNTLSGSVTPKTSHEERNYDKNKVQHLPYTTFPARTILTTGDVYELAGQMWYIKALSGSGKDQIAIIDLNPRETRDTYTYDVTITDVVKK